MKGQTVRQSIVSSFPKWNPQSLSFVPAGMRASDYQFLRASIYDTPDERLPAQLGLLLLNLLDDHPAALATDKTYHKLLRFLDANWDGIEDALEMPENAVEFEAVQNTKEASFKGFSLDQRRCVRDWLGLAREWKCSEPLSFEFESALKFWDRLSRASREGRVV